MAKELDPGDYDTDKRLQPHYLENFKEHLGHLAEQPIVLLELGVYHGGSLLMWRDYFSAARIVGIDIKPVSIEDESGRISFFQGAQQDTEFLDRVAASTAPRGFDVIIDDASHIGELTRTSFWHLFDNHLKPGGIYVIEDWGTGYWSKWSDGRDYGRPEARPHHVRKRVGGIAPQLAEQARKKMSTTIEWYAKKLGVRDFELPAVFNGQGFRKRFPSHDYGIVGVIKELVDECGMGDITHPKWTNRAHRESKFKRMVISHGHVFVYKAT